MNYLLKISEQSHQLLSIGAGLLGGCVVGIAAKSSQSYQLDLHRLGINRDGIPTVTDARLAVGELKQPVSR